MKNIVLGFFILLLLSIVGCSKEKKVDKSKLLGNDYRLFQDTPAWSLAKAVHQEDFDAVKAEKAKGISINFREPRFGNTLLMLAITNNNYNSAKELLALGADPNIKDRYRGASAVIDAASNNDAKYLELILEYKGDPDAVESAPTKGTDFTRNTALSASIGYFDNESLAKVKLLTEAGANINYYNEYSILPLSKAIALERMDIALFLLQSGADYSLPMRTTVEGIPVYILEDLRRTLFEIDSKKHYEKMKVVNFLRQKGMDYWKSPIPIATLKEIKEKHPTDWLDYIEKY